MSGIAIRMVDVSAGYYPGHAVLRGVSLTAAAGKLTVVLGPNGAGKSTVLRVVAGLLRPEVGRILLDGQDIHHVAAHRHLELGIAFLPQGRSTFPDLTVDENLELGGWPLRVDRRRLRSAVEAMFERYPTLKPLRHRPAGSLSGGQQRTVEIARMLVSEPKVLLIDEPSVGLSPIATDQVYEELTALRAEGRTILLVDQNVRAAVNVADYVFTLESGANHREGGREQFEGDLGALIKGWLRV